METEQVVTVTGPIAPHALGITHSHEHILWDYFAMIPSYDTIFDDVDVATSEVQRFAEAGGGTLVDCTSGGIGPRPADLRTISERTGVSIVLGSGWYRESVYDDVVFRKTSIELAEILVQQLTTGFDDTGVKAGFIGEIGTERGCITPAEERVFRAAALAANATNCAIITHTTHFGELALEQINLLESCGVDPARIVVSHLGDRENVDHLLAIAERGVYLSIDNIGYEGDGYPSDDVRLKSVLRLLEAGYVNRTVLGTDIGTRSALHTYGGRGFGWLIEHFLPRLEAHGVSQQDIDTMTSMNMATALARPITDASDHQ